MDRRERSTTDEERLRAAFDSVQAGLWTALPAIVQSFDPAKMTITAQPSIQGIVRDERGNLSFVNMPLLVDCPVVFPSGGGFTLTFPIAAGDECLMIFSARCIDAWWQSGGIQAPMELRMHNLSDGFAIPCVFSQPRALSGVSSNTTQLRSNDGETYVEVAGGGVVNVVAPTSINLTAPNVTITASTSVMIDTPIETISGILDVQNTEGEPEPCTINGDIVTNGDVIASGVSLNSHHHTGVTTGGSNTGGPV